jgi:DNA-binding IclR family transcriptional regulator
MTYVEENSSNKFYIQSINRALAIIDVISKSSESGMALTAIAEKVDLPISTAYRIIQNLTEWQYIKEDESGIYTLGFAFITLGNIAKNNIGLRNVAHKYISELGDITKETIYLAILDEGKGEIIYIDKIDSKRNIKLAAGVGNRNYIHSTANGKVLVSGFSDGKIREILKNSNMPKLTPTTLSDIDKFLAEVNKVRQNGYAVDDQENELEVSCVAAPIMDYRKKVVGSLSISGISSTMTAESIDKVFKNQVMEAARKVSKELGYRE